jgi:phenylpropionate dioxygenase-like ring-hydroxylating dioxygenase large terminal subunit
MDGEKYFIDPDIRKAYTLPAEFYRDTEIYNKIKNSVFPSLWHLIGDTEIVKIPGQVYPFTLLEGFIDEPLLFTRDNDDNIHCLSNVCTHRGNILVENPENVRLLQCRYHRRRFELNGCFKSMPECDDAVNFPSEADNLTKIPFKEWNNFLFASLNPKIEFDEIFGIINKRMDGVKTNPLIFEPTRTRDYLVKANWALYIDNYLEGFHIPYVHNSLNAVIDYGTYTTELYDYCNLQLAIAKPGEECFTLHEISPDYGNEVAAYYWWVFPNMMLNYYPWGLSINIVKPLDVKLTKISFITYVSDHKKLDNGAGSGLDRVEREDEAVVEAVQKGVQSRFYDRGRYSPKRETGVHHFHRLLVKALS